MLNFLLSLLTFIIKRLIPLLGLMLLIAVPVLILNINPYIRSKAVAKLEEQFPDAVVSLDSAEFIHGKGIRLRRLQIRFPKTAFLNSKSNPVNASELILPESKSGLYDFVSVEEMFIVTQQSIQDLLFKGLSIERVQLRNADVVLYPVDNERWNFQFLHFTRQKKNTPFREIELDDVDCQIRDYRKDNATFELRDIKAQMTLKANNVYDIVGVMTGDYAKSMNYSGLLNLDKKQVNIEANVSQCELSDRLYNSLPLEVLPRDEIARLMSEMRLVKNVMGIMSSKCLFSYDGSAEMGKKLHYRVIGEVVNGRWDWSASSEPLTNIHIKYDVSEKEANIQSFSANMGTGNIQMAYRQLTYEKNAPKELRIKLGNMPIDKRLVAKLPQKVTEIWESIQPSGLVTADAYFKFDGKTWSPYVKLQCQNGTMLYKKFPYALSNLVGTIELNNQKLNINLKDNDNITLNGEFLIPADVFTIADEKTQTDNPNNSPLKKISGYFLVKGRKIAITDKVVNACPQKAQDLIHQFDPKGTVDVDVRLDVRGNGTPIDLIVDIGLINCSGRYELFPYPLRSLNGRLYMKNHFWTFENLTVSTTPVKMTGSGRVNLQPDQPHDFFLKLKMTDLPVDKVLTSSMPEENAKLIHGLGITGSVNAEVDIAMRIGVDKGPKLKIHAVPTGEEFSMRAASFPYRLDKVSGTIDYENGRFTIKDFTGYHNQTLLCCQIDGIVIPGSGWKANLSKVAIDRLIVDRDLINAIPESIRKTITSLNLKGPLHYRGIINLHYNYKHQTPLSAQWNGEIGVQEVSISKGITFRGICGGITTAGYMINGEFYSEGQLAIESALWNMIQFSNIKGPYQINNYQAFFGSAAPQILQSLFPKETNTFQRSILNVAGNEKAQPLTAKVFGGDFTTDVVLLFNEPARFCVFSNLKNARLEQCGEVTQSDQLLGKFRTVIKIWGLSDDINTLGGQGDLWLEEADIYHLPVMVSLLKLLSIKEPSQNAFSNSEASFRFSGPHMFFDKINFRGDAISLYGSGEMDFNKRVNMSFYTQVGKGDYKIPVFDNILKGVSKSILRIRLEGPINQLQIQRESPLFEDPQPRPSPPTTVQNRVRR